MIIAVTGAFGFIGSNLVKALNELGYTDIIAVDNLTNGSKIKNLADCQILDFVDKEDFIKEKGIEVGNIFKLGTKYSLPFELKYRDKYGTEKPVIMGCYGIGVNRILAGLAETRHDEQGLIWPLSIAPYEVIVSVIGANEPETLAAAERLYAELQAAGVDVLLDDRDLRPGVKFKDADLIGIPLRVNFGGKGLKEGVVELKWRTAADSERVPLADALTTVVRQLAEKKKSDAANLPS